MSKLCRWLYEMKIGFWITLITTLLAVVDCKGQTEVEGEENDQDNNICNFSYGKKLEARGFADLFYKGKQSVGSAYEKGKGSVDLYYQKGKDSTELISSLNEVLSDISKIQLIKSKAGKKFSEQIEKGQQDDTIENLLTKVFSGLKKSGLLLPIIEMTLTNEKTRAAIIDIAINLIEADVIPYEEIFDALKDSGLAIQVVGFSLKDECTRKGLVKLIVELIPELISSGALSPKEILRLINDSNSKSIEASQSRNTSAISLL